MSDDIKAMAEQLDKFTEAFLENNCDSTIPPLIISFNGKTVEIPLDLADTNNTTQVFLDDLVNILLEYEM